MKKKTIKKAATAKKTTKPSNILTQIRNIKTLYDAKSIFKQRPLSKDAQCALLDKASKLYSAATDLVNYITYETLTAVDVADLVNYITYETLTAVDVADGVSSYAVDVAKRTPSLIPRTIYCLRCQPDVQKTKDAIVDMLVLAFEQWVTNNYSDIDDSMYVFWESYDEYPQQTEAEQQEFADDVIIKAIGKIEKHLVGKFCDELLARSYLPPKITRILLDHVAAKTTLGEVDIEFLEDVAAYSEDYDVLLRVLSFRDRARDLSDPDFDPDIEFELGTKWGRLLIDRFSRADVRPLRRDLTNLLQFNIATDTNIDRKLLMYMIYNTTLKPNVIDALIARDDSEVHQALCFAEHITRKTFNKLADEKLKKFVAERGL